MTIKLKFKLKLKIIFSLIGFLFFILSPISAFPATHENGRTEYDDLKEIYQTGMPQKLREILNSYLKLDPNNPKDQEKLDEVKEYLPLFREKFIAGSMKKYNNDRDCGKNSYNIGLFISYKQMEHLNIYLREIGKNEYEICDVMQYPMTDLRRKRYFYWRKFKKYWI